MVILLLSVLLGRYVAALGPHLINQVGELNSCIFNLNHVAIPSA